MISELVCVQCGQQYKDGEATTCQDCGIAEGILDVHFDVPAAARTLTVEALARRPLSIWRYYELLPVRKPIEPALACIGFTPLIEAPRLAEALGVGRLRLKDDSRSASGSFKDRASAIAVQRALQEGFKEIACASTGNAASSLAHCAAAVGMPANIFVSQIVPAGKLLQLLAYGARVFKVQGTYAQAYELCIQTCDELKWYNRNAAINPYLVEGKKTGGMEIAEQCRKDPPEWVAVSVGDGCSIAGVAKGIQQMKDLGITDFSAHMLGVQAENVAPICKAFADPNAKLDRSGTGSTYADSIDVPVPRNWRKAVNAVRNSAGAYVTVSDDQIREAVRQTGRLAGIFAEPAAAASVAGIARARADGLLNERSDVVAVITGNGLKDPQGAATALPHEHQVQPELNDVLKIVNTNSPG